MPRHLDLAAAAAAALLAGLAYAALPAGAFLRVAAAAAMLLFVPGHLLLHVVAGPAATARDRALRAAAAVGATPPLVGLAALSTALLPGGFRPAAIVLALVALCVALAGVAAWRRRAPAAGAAADPGTAPPA